MVVSFITVCSLVFFKGRVNKQISEDQCNEELTTETKQHVSGELIIWESISRYITVGYH